jgi:hypothetical protein
LVSGSVPTRITSTLARAYSGQSIEVPTTAAIQASRVAASKGATVRATAILLLGFDFSIFDRRSESGIALTYGGALVPDIWDHRAGRLS